MSSNERKRKLESADALDDDLEYDVGSDFAAGLESIHDGESDDAAASIDGDDQHDLSTATTGTEAAAAAKSVKPKNILTPEEKREKRKQRKQVTKKRKAQQEQEDGDENDGNDTHDGGDEPRQSVQSVDQQSDALALLTRTHAPRTITSIELNDLIIPTSVFIDTTTFQVARNLDSLLPFIKQFSQREKLEVAPKQVGTPHTLVLASSAIRVADLCRALKPLKNSSASQNKKDAPTDVAKLFGKEKANVQCEWLGKTRVNIAVGVPARVTLCVERGALKMDKIEQIYLDATYRDAKKRGLVQIKEVAGELIKFLQLEGIKSRLASQQCRICFF